MGSDAWPVFQRVPGAPADAVGTVGPSGFPVYRAEYRCRRTFAGVPELVRVSLRVDCGRSFGYLGGHRFFHPEIGGAGGRQGPDPFRAEIGGNHPVFRNLALRRVPGQRADSFRCRRCPGRPPAQYRSAPSLPGHCRPQTAPCRSASCGSPADNPRQ